MSKNNLHNSAKAARPNTLWLAFWAGADKILPLVYGVAMVLIPLRSLPHSEWAIWTVTQMLFMIISLVAEFFILQPMVKISSETNETYTPTAPIILASLFLYSLFCVLLTIVVLLLANPLETLFKTQMLASAFPAMGLMILSTIIRNVSIRVLQIYYRIAAIFLVDLAYFLPVVGLMYLGNSWGKLNNAILLIKYNYYAFLISSFVGIMACMPQFMLFLRRYKKDSSAKITMNIFIISIKKILSIGVHQGGTGVLTVLQQQGDVAIVSGVRGGAEVGIYNAARLFYRTFDAIRDAVQLLLVPAASRAFSSGRHDSVGGNAILSTALLFVFFLPVTVTLILLAPVIVPAVMPNYPQAADCFRWLFVSGVAMPFVIVPSAILLGIGEAKELFYGTLIGTLVLLIFGFMLTWFQGPVGMAQAVSIGTFATAILLTKKMNNYIHFTLKSVIKQSKRLPAIFKQTVLDLVK